MCTNTAGRRESRFVSDLQRLPVVNESLDLVSDLYEWTKNYRCVGMAVDMAVSVASPGIWAATSVPLAVLVHTMGGWDTIDEWAYLKLQTMKTRAPILKKFITCVIDDVETKLLRVVAGCPEINSVLPTLTGALITRFEKTVSKLNEFETGRRIVAAADGLIGKAHALVDQYLPPIEGPFCKFDMPSRFIPDEGVVWETLTLAIKSHLRVYCAAHIFVHKDPNCDDISTLHIARCAGNYAKETFSLAVRNVQPDDATLMNISALLFLHTAHNLNASLEALATVTASLVTASPSKFASASLLCARDAAERNLKTLAYVFLLVKISCINAETCVLEFRVWLAALLQNVMVVLHLKSSDTSS
ncbi:uncharacterized protein [Procambarus clarkii]|uniref:uncharacterized protein n=1 Tax=Procambarus clarkii TaxID=6728 RepID=UPI003743A3EF